MQDKEPIWLPDCTFVCEVPRPLGAVTRLKKRGGKIVAETESGIEMIVPVNTPKD